MTDYNRFGVYYLPPPGPLSSFGASWLGWDIDAGMACTHLPVPDLPDLTAPARKYGFHATLKPPFRLIDGVSEQALLSAVDAVASAQAPVSLNGLELAQLGRFLALVPTGDCTGLNSMAGRIVRDLDCFRAPATPEELERRRAPHLSEAQRENLRLWGYPHVMDNFRFHMTLTGKMPKPLISSVRKSALAHLPEIPQPYVISQIALVGERPDGMFETVRRYQLRG